MIPQVRWDAGSLGCQLFLAPVGSVLSLFLVGSMKCVKCSLLLCLLVDFSPTELLLKNFSLDFPILICDEVIVHRNQGV